MLDDHIRQHPARLVLITFSAQSATAPGPLGKASSDNVEAMLSTGNDPNTAPPTTAAEVVLRKRRRVNRGFASFMFMLTEPFLTVGLLTH